MPSNPETTSERPPLRVLLVEDSAIDAELLVEALREGGYEPVWKRVDTAAGLTAALLAQEWDVVACDYVLPSFGAPAALQLIKEHSPDTPVIIISGQVSEEIAVSAVKGGACDYLNKNKLARLCPAIERELRDAEERRARKHAEALVRQLAAIVESSDDAIIGQSVDGTITSWNPSAQKMYGYTPQEAIGRSISMLVPPSLRDKVSAMLDRVGRGEHVGHFETVHFRKDGQPVHVSLTISAIADEHGALVGVSTISRDIGERKRAEEALQRRAAELEEANRLKDLFADIIRHDLLNPVSVIRGATEMLLEAPDDLDRTELAILARRSAQKLEDIIKAASLYSKLESAAAIERRETDLNPLFQAIVDDLKPFLAERNQRLDYQAPGKCVALVNPLIESVFANLVTNASKYSPEGQRIEATVVDRGDHYQLSVKDWGAGIRDEHKPKLFTRFQRLNQEGIKGIGLGLAIVKRIIELHHGRVWVEDNPEGGTVFRVEIPKR